jgi:hypothetical protein
MFNLFHYPDGGRHAVAGSIVWNDVADTRQGFEAKKETADCYSDVLDASVEQTVISASNSQQDRL